MACTVLDSYFRRQMVLLRILLPIASKHVHTVHMVLPCRYFPVSRLLDYDLLGRTAHNMPISGCRGWWYVLKPQSFGLDMILSQL